VPAVPLIPILSIAACLWLMVNLSVETWVRFLIWLAIGFVVYFAYGQRSSRLGKGLRQAEVDGDVSGGPST
jgi:APA family basic amino acid/polyamine antiporter